MISARPAQIASRTPKSEQGAMGGQKFEPKVRARSSSQKVEPESRAKKIGLKASS